MIANDRRPIARAVPEIAQSRPDEASPASGETGDGEELVFTITGHYPKATVAGLIAHYGRLVSAVAPPHRYNRIAARSNFDVARATVASGRSGSLQSFSLSIYSYRLLQYPSPPARYRFVETASVHGRGRGKTSFAGDGGPTSMVRSRRGLRADPGTQARIACSSGPTPMIAITRFML